MSTPADAVRVTLAGAGLVRPQLMMRASGDHPDAAADAVVRVLAARWLVQVAGGRFLSRRTYARAAATIDLIHAATAAAWAVRGPAHRRAAAGSATLATVLAASDLVAARRLARRAG